MIHGGGIRHQVKNSKRRTSLPTRLGGGNGRRKKTTEESPRSARKRAFAQTSRSPIESCHSQKRATDILQTVKSRYQNVDIRDLPSCIRQTRSRETDHPLSLKYDPSTIPKPKQKDDTGRVADVLLAMKGGKLGNVEIGHSKMAGRAVFAILGFGEFEVRRGGGLRE